MKKKLLPILISLILSLFLVGCIAMATSENYAPDTVVAVNGVELTQAEVADGKLATLLSDCRMGGTIEVVRDFSVTSITLGANTDGDASKWVINGNGHTITDSDNTARNGESHTNFLVYITNSVVEINDLTLKTGASGIRANETYADITLNNVSVYASATVPGTTVTELPTTSASTLKRYAYALYFRGSAEEHYGQSLDNISVTVNGGEYKSAGADGTVVYLRGASMVVNGGTFVGEDCTYVVWVYNLDSSKTLEGVSASFTVHSGLFVRPVYSGVAVGSSNPDAAVGGVIRVTHGALFNSHGGTYINCDGTMVAEGESAPGSYVIVAGTGSYAGIINIYGGEFYQLSAVGSTSGEVIGHYAGTMDTAPDKVIDLCRATILGGRFYVREGLPNSNLMAVVNAKADSSVTDNDNTTIQRAVWSEFATAVTEGVVTKTAYGVEYTDLVEISFSYTGVAGSYRFSVTNPDGTVYYTDDLSLAFNSLAQDKATIKILSKKEITTKGGAHIRVLNRNLSVTLTSGGSTNNQLIFNPNSSYTYDDPYAIFIRSGKLTINNKTVIKTRSEQTAFYFGLPGDKVYPLRLTVVMNDARFVRGDSLILKDNGCAEGTISTTSCKANYAGSSSYTSYSYSARHTYPTPKPDIKVYTSLTLSSGFDVNFYLPIEGNRVTDFTIGGVTTSVENMEIVDVDGTPCYKVSVKAVGPAEAMCAIPFSLNYNSQNGYFTYSAASGYSITKYATAVMSDTTQPPSAHSLIAGVMNYVNASYLYFGNVAGATDAELSALAAFVETYPADLPTELPEGPEVDEAPIADIISGIYFDLSSSSAKLTLVFSNTAAPFEVSIDGRVLLSLPSGHGEERVAVSIRAHDLTKVITMTSGDTTATYSLIRYAEQALAESPSDALLTILLAMHTYGDTAKGYKQYLEAGTEKVYDIVYPTGDTHLAEMAQMMRQYLFNHRGVSFNVRADDGGEGVTSDAYEILLGATDRVESSVSCPTDSFYIEVTENKIVLFGNDAFYSDMAILYLLENLVSEMGSESFITEDAGYTLIKSEENSLGAYLKYTDIVSDELTYIKETKYSKKYGYSDGTITTNSKYADSLDGVTLAYTLQQSQGAASDGEYLYIVHTNPKNDGAEGADDEDITHIYKVDPTTMKVVTIGPRISVRHANDMVYDSKRDKLLVIYSYGNWVAELDTSETLADGSANPNYLGVRSAYKLGGDVTYTTLVPDTANGGYTTASLAFHGIGYDAVNDRYVAATSGATSDGYGMVSFILDEDGNAIVTGIIDTPNLNYTKQGANADSYYVYHTQSYPSSDAERDSYVVVCDWEGNHVRTLKIPYPDSGTNTIEIETIMWLDGTPYIAANRGGSLTVVRLGINYIVD